MMNYRLSFLIIVSMVVAACGGAPTPATDYDWCYTHYFTDEYYGSSIPLLYANWSSEGGLSTISGEMNVPPFSVQTLFDVYPEKIEIHIYRPEDVEGDVPIYAVADVYGWPLVINQVIPASLLIDDLVVDFSRVYNPINESGSSLSLDLRTFNEGDGQTPPYKDVGLYSLKVYGSGASPFQVNECDDNPPTPTATNTNRPSPTPVPACWGAEWDFREGQRGFSGTTWGGNEWGGNAGFQSALTENTPILSKRELNVSNELDPSSPPIHIVRVPYYAEKGFGAGDITLSLDGIEVASEPISAGDNYLVFNVYPLLVTFDEIEINAVIGESPSAADPGGYIRISSIELFGLGSAPIFYNSLIPTLFLVNCPTFPTNTPAPTISPTPTPTGTPPGCFRLDYDYRISAYDALDQPIHFGAWVPGVGIIPQEFHPNSSQWAHLYSIRAQGNGLPIRRIEFEFSSIVPGIGIGDWQLNLFSGGINVMEVYPTANTFFSWDGAATGGSVRFSGYIGNDQTNPASDPGGSAVLQRITIFGVGTPTGWQGVLTSLPCWDITPTPTPVQTSTNTPFPMTATSTRTNTPTRTPIPTLSSPTPTRTPFIIPSATPTVATATPTITPTRTPTIATATRTSSPTRTATGAPTITQTPSETPLPLPTSETATPVETATGTPIVPTFPPPPPTLDLPAIPTYGLPTLDPYPDYEYTALPQIDLLQGYYGDVRNQLSTAAAQVNELPIDISGQIPDTSASLPLFSGYAKWLTSGVSLQEILGRKIYPIGQHIFYGLYAVIFVVGITLIVRSIILIFKVAVWIIQQILKIFPFVG